ncbi:hypothetical protein SKAU_G00103760 [Synaphobranchus kaupii]|uniref:Uncharacterized protein n=1 Tax=Synaphobranchus kaupii TaxID=118154 RepID=A0A9Q1FZW0_SYNKA|nr:hypothetical protein SKAU_G00103760 [Synaphobranchus kaupii]
MRIHNRSTESRSANAMLVHKHVSCLSSGKKWQGSQITTASLLAPQQSKTDAPHAHPQSTNRGPAKPVTRAPPL